MLDSNIYTPCLCSTLIIVFQFSLKKTTKNKKKFHQSNWTLQITFPHSSRLKWTRQQETCYHIKIIFRCLKLVCITIHDHCLSLHILSHKILHQMSKSKVTYENQKQNFSSLHVYSSKLLVPEELNCQDLFWFPVQQWILRNPYPPRCSLSF